MQILKRLSRNSLGLCRIDGCHRCAVAAHLCAAHYSKFRKYGDPLAGRTNKASAMYKRVESKPKQAKPEKVNKPRQKCSIEGCHAISKSRGLCSTHYQRFRRFGDPLAPLKIITNCSSSICKVDGCDSYAKKRGWCLLHYNRWRRHGNPGGDQMERSPNGSQEKCSVDSCETNAIAFHLCHKHYSKFKKYGDPLGGTFNDGRSKEWRANKNGYIERFDPSHPYAASNGSIFQHRQVMGEHIGRPLRKDESVHHKNGNRSDNRLENLELWSKSQPAGQRVADKVKWAREILQEYGNMF